MPPRASRAEIAYYLEHHLEGARPGGARRPARPLRRGAAGRAGAARAGPRHRPEGDAGRARVPPFPEVHPALRGAAGAPAMRLVVVSNWDCSLPEWLGPTGVLGLLDGVVSSAEVGAAKPDPAPFRRGLELAGVEARAALHVGDSLENDVEGARAAGVRAVLVARGGPPPPGVERCARSPSGLPTLRADGSRGRPAPPDPPELPEGAAPRWPAWYAGVGLPGGAHARRWWPWGSCGAITGVDDRRGRRHVHVVGHAGPERGLHRDGRPVRVVHAASRRPGTSGSAGPRSGRRWGGPRSAIFSFYVAGGGLLGDGAARRRADGGRGPGRRPGHLRADRRRLHDRLRGARSRRSSSSAGSSTRRCARATRRWRAAAIDAAAVRASSTSTSPARTPC